MIKQAIKLQAGILLLIITMFIPVITGATEIEVTYTPLSTFTTKFSAGNTARANNIKLAAEKLNGVVIEPGETFSFNDTVGATTGKNGFKIAKILVDGEERRGYGGGVCQVSSTLYNAALTANLLIVERHPHSKKVHYVPEGRDAATSRRSNKDFKFTNNYDVPIAIYTYTTKNSVTVDIGF